MKKHTLISFFLLTFFITSHNTSFSSDSTAETQIDNFISNGVMSSVFPGGQLLIAKSGIVIYDKVFGSYTYDENSPHVTKSTLYDLASLTKVVATTPAIMKLYEMKKLDVNDKVAGYIPEFANNGKEDITIKNLLLHNSGLKAWIPFYQTCSGKEDVLNTIYNISLDYTPETKTVYSDLNAVLLGEIVERVSGKSLEEFCREYIFKELDMQNTGFNLNSTQKGLAAPTENDVYWRKKQLQGEVHDECAYLMGGVSGNAGLFSNAEDLYKYMNMLIKRGEYYNPHSNRLVIEEMFKPETVDLFTTRFSNFSYYNSRALGWDTKPEPKGSTRTQCGEMMSENCFGHTGYTGTSIWYDKDRELLIIFLTNRVYPTRDNTAMRDFRPDLHNKIIELYN
ncbi:MAG TPA: serine hydrolase [Ignavibacteria bacterium]|nr:serine hydrolase [Ignavibacteria bacterium]